LLLVLGLAGFDALRQQVAAACRHLDYPCAMQAAYGETGFAVILPRCDRRTAVQLGDELLRNMHGLKTAGRDGPQPAVTLSIGVAAATPAKNFQPQQLLAAADHCLYGSRSSGGGVVKSIEI
jgi:diguanylate cyclase (GGDEF)-like protein